MASLTPAPTSMIDRLEKYLLSCLQGENIEKIQICSKKHFIYVGNFQTLFIQNYIAIFSEEDPFYRTHNSEIGNRIRKHLYPWASLCKRVCSSSLNHGLKSMILLTWTDLWTNCTTIISYLNMLQNFNLQPMLSTVNLFM